MNLPKRTKLQRAQNKEKAKNEISQECNYCRHKKKSIAEVKSDKESENHLMDYLCFPKSDKTNTSKLCEFSSTALPTL